MELSFSNYVTAIEGQADGLPVTQLPRHLFALYLGGYLAEIEIEQMRSLLAARAYVSSVTYPLTTEMLAIARGVEVDDPAGRGAVEQQVVVEQIAVHGAAWQAGLSPRAAVEKLFNKDELQPQLLELMTR